MGLLTYNFRFNVISKIFLVAFCYLLSYPTVTAQNIDRVSLSENYRNLSNSFVLKNKKKKNQETIILSVGVGTITPLSSSTYRFLLTANAYLHLGKLFYLGLGTDIYPEPKYGLTTIYTISIVPNLGFDISEKMFKLYLGSGLYIYNPPVVGIVTSVRFEYNIRRISMGMEIKHPYFFGKEFDGTPLILANLYLAIKF